MKINAYVALLMVVSVFLLSPYTAYGRQDTTNESLTIDRIFSDPNLNGPQAKAVRFSPDGKRVTFLKGKQEDSRVMDLWEYNLSTKSVHLLVDSNMIMVGDEVLSDIEKARRERMRLYSKGIVDYQWSQDSRRLIFPMGGDVYLATLGDGNSVDIKRLLNTEAFETDFKFSPKSNFISFVRDFDLYAIDLKSGKEKRLTHDAKGTVKNAVAEFAAQEEMSRHTGYWWSPDEEYIAFTQIDEAPIKIAQRYQVYANKFKVTEERYPFAGTPNVFIKVGVVGLSHQKIKWMDIGKEKDIYIPRVKWLRDARTLSIQRQSRNQKVLDLLFSNVETGKTKRILREKSKTWVNLHNDLYFFKNKPWFVWSSERDGNNHLYLYSLKGRLQAQLTKGRWQVFSLKGVNEKNNTIYFDANKKTPLEKHLYSVNWMGKRAGNAKQITSRHGWHTIKLAKDNQSYIDAYSSAVTPSQVSVHNVKGEHLQFIEENKLDKTHPYYAYQSELPAVEFGQLQANDKQTLHYKLQKPKGFDPRKRYPVIVHVYGGPTAQLVRNVWDSRWGHVNHVLANNGYIVFTLDNRGSENRERKFTDVVYHKLGTIEVDDQVTGVNYLKSLPYVDGENVGIYGWSYGGYMTLMAMFKAADTFKVGVAGAPVTDWALYDTHYTERYLGTPQDDANAYAEGNVLNYVDGLKGKLLLVHGMADDNVLLNHSTLLMQAMQDKDIAFDLMMYPGQTHRITGYPRQRHLFKMMLRYFDNHLKKN